VHASAKLLGPVIVQDGAHAGRRHHHRPGDHRRRATVGANALVVQCIVQPETDIAESAVIRQRSSRAFPARRARCPRLPTTPHARASEPLRDEIGPPLYPTVKLRIESALRRPRPAGAAALAIIALLVKLESRGPKLCRQARSQGRTDVQLLQVPHDDPGR
jgi:hypothetical protein